MSGRNLIFRIILLWLLFDYHLMFYHCHVWWFFNKIWYLSILFGLPLTLHRNMIGYLSTDCIVYAALCILSLLFYVSYVLFLCLLNLLTRLLFKCSVFHNFYVITCETYIITECNNF